MADIDVSLAWQVPGFGLDVSLRADGPVVLVGPNGSGKTSILRALAGALTGLTGHIRVGGRDLMGVPPEQRRVGYLPQGYGLFRHLSALDNVAFGIAGSRAQRREQARLHLERLGVGKLADRRPVRLSGGEQQRVALARALATGPEILLLDEPTAALDVGARKEIRELLNQVMAERRAVIVTHDVRDLVAWSPQVVLVREGRVAATGSVDQLVGSRDPFLSELLAPAR